MRSVIRVRHLWLLLLGFTALASQAKSPEPQSVDETMAAAAPAWQSQAQADEKSAGCQSCHTQTDQKTMHASPAVVLGCTDCHGGDAAIHRPETTAPDATEYRQLQELAHVQPRYPQDWNYPSSANPPASYTLLNRESAAYVRFVNPGDYRAADLACGACHADTIAAARRSLMSTGAMLWGGAAYNNGILPYKRYLLGESYTDGGVAAKILNPIEPTAAMQAKGVLPELWPLPAWETVAPADVFRVFERGGRNILNLFPETGLPGIAGNIQRLEEPGRPDLRQSNRGPGTGNRIAVPLLNIHKTRLNDPLAWFLGTNEQPGDYRSSGCSACHVVYANDRTPRHSAGYAAHGHQGQSVSADPTIPRGESGHPLRHEFTRAIPTSQCMVCHMHQPNIFVNSFLGYTMWDYESDAPAMWPEKQRYPSDEEIRAINERNPEEAAIRGLWGEPEFLAAVSELNPELEHTQFADYHGHGWNFRAIHKRDRQGRLLDAEDKIIDFDDPDKWQKTVHMASVHAEAGMHCVDCHFAQDSHGNGHIYGEVAQAIEIECQDCHGTADHYPTLRSSGPAAPPGGTALDTVRLTDGRPRFQWLEGALYQNSALTPGLQWKVSLVKDAVSTEHAEYNPKAARAKLMAADTAQQHWGPEVTATDRAHRDEEMMCTTCHTSWTTSCSGCHLPIQANWKTERKHYEGGETRNYSTYNPQVVREDMFMLGRHGEAKGYRIAPIRSSSALVLSSTNANREKIYIQQPPVAASGFSSQAFAPHFAHTVRKNETRQCSDCHLSENDDNNAWLQQLMGQGSNFPNFIGYYAWLGLDSAVQGVQVTEWDEPQAVIGSYLHRHAYPDWFKDHQKAGQQLQTGHQYRSGDGAQCVQLRGEYLYAAEGAAGVRVYDVASIANKGFSQRIIQAPFSELGHDTHVELPQASCIALPTNQPIAPDRNQGELMRHVNQEQPFHPLYRYAVASDRERGLVLIEVDSLNDGDPRNNRLEATLAFNPQGRLSGARHLHLAGTMAYVSTPQALVAVSLDQPLNPRITAEVPLRDVRASALQFRYLFVTTADGLVVLDASNAGTPNAKPVAQLALKDARKLYLARTYAYVAGGDEGLIIIDIERPTAPQLIQRFNPDGQLGDAQDVVVASTNASLYAYVAAGRHGLQVVQLTAPDTQPGFYGFSPQPQPQRIAHYPTSSRALAISKGLDRDRAVDEHGNQIAVFGRLGSRPFNAAEMRKLYLDRDGQPWTVQD